MSISDSAGINSNCFLATPIALRHRATRSSGSSQWVGSSATSPETRLVQGRTPSPGANRHRHHGSQGLVGQRIVGQQVLAQTAGADRHHDVIYRATGGIFQALDIFQ